MRDTDYDRLVSVFLFTCGKEIDDNSLICHLFFAQKLGFNLDFNFKVNQRGVSSSKAESFLKDLIISGELSYDNERGLFTFPIRTNKDCVRVSADDFYLLESISDVLSDLESWELSFLVTLAIIQEDCFKRQGVNKVSFDELRDGVISAMKRLCPNYTDDLFEGASSRLLILYNLV